MTPRTKQKDLFSFLFLPFKFISATWTLDLKNGTGSIAVGTVAGVKPDITIDIQDQDFIDLAEGKANGQKLFMSGKIKAKGAVMLATKLDTVLKANKAQAKL